MVQRKRPLSPHLQIYRPMYTMVLSITHRISGVLLSIGALLLTWWLFALASGRESYAPVLALLSTLPGKLLLLGWLLSFCFHFSNGIRHLAWDAGFGFEKHQARASGWVVVLATLVLTGVCVAIALRIGRGGA